MEGAVLAAERNHERALLEAYHGAAWTGAAFAGKLKRFSEYRTRQSHQQSAEQMLGALMTLKDMGAPIDIRRVN